MNKFFLKFINLKLVNKIAVVSSLFAIIALIFLGVNYQRINTNFNDEKSVAHTKISRDIPAPNENDHYRFKSNSKYTLVIYASTDCIYCRKFDTYLENNLPKYENKFNLVYRYAPLSSDLNLSSEKALISECVYNQGGDKKMFEFIKDMHSNYKTGEANNGWVKDIAKNHVSNRGGFSDCLNNKDMQSKVINFKIKSVATGITGVMTVGVFNNGVLVSRFDRISDVLVIKLIDYLARFPGFADQFWSDEMFQKINI